MNNPEQVTYFAETDARNQNVRFGIKAKDRTRHVYVIGKTGLGKSTLLENMAVQDIQHGNGFAFLDPHGQTAETLLQYIPEERLKDVLYFAPFDLENPVSFNVMEDVGYDKRHLVVSGLMSTYKKIWQDAWSARMEYILSNTLLALLEYPDATLLAVNKMLADKKFRDEVVSHVTDPAVKSFWVDEFAKYTDRFAVEATAAIQNKIGQFTSNPLIRNIIGQPKSSFDIREMMDDRKILIVNLSKGQIGESNANLLGSMLITKIYLSAMSRADLTKDKLADLPNFYLFVDEFQSFANESFADILSEARKYKLNLTIAHQYIEQMSEEVRAAVFGNVGTMVTFRVGAGDAEYLEKEFAPEFTAQDLVNLGFAQIYLRLMIDGIGSKPFSARTLPPLSKPDINYVDHAIAESRRQFSRPRQEVEEIVRKLISHDDLKAGSKSSDNGGGNGGNNNSKKSSGKGGNNGGNNSGNHGSFSSKNGNGNRGGEGNYQKNKNGEEINNQDQGFNQNSNHGSNQNQHPKTKPALSNEQRRELEKMLFERQAEAEAEAQNNSKNNSANNSNNKEVVDIESESISLKNLSKNTAKNDGKGATANNRNQLKDALSKALGDRFEKVNKSNESGFKKGNDDMSKSNTNIQKHKNDEDQVSEAELKALLDVD